MASVDFKHHVYLLTIDWTKNILIFSTSKLKKTSNPVYFNRWAFFLSPHSLCSCAVKFNFVDPLLPQKTYSFLVKLVQWPMLTNPGLILVCCNPIYPYCSVFQTFIINYVCILCIFNNRKRNSEFIRPVPQAGQMLLASINSIFNYITTKKYSGLWPAADERVLREEADVHNTDFGRK